MPKSSHKICHKAGCGELTYGRFCDPHKAEYHRNIRQARGSSTKQGYGSRWERYSKLYRKQNTLCVACLSEGKLTPSEVVDHIIPHRKDDHLKWDADNHQPLCKVCHDHKIDPV